MTDTTKPMTDTAEAALLRLLGTIESQQNLTDLARVVFVLERARVALSDAHAAMLVARPDHAATKRAGEALALIGKPWRIDA